MDYYLASDEKNKKQAKSLIRKLKSKGFNCLNEVFYIDNSVSDSEEQSEKAIEKAAFILIYLTAGKGSLHEIGYALSLQKKIILYSPEKENYHIGKNSIFRNMPEVMISSGTFYKLVKQLRTME
ncbi:TIR domain-containing protein [Bacillus massiliglaciei]|uniref:hypothetical protein n=1 Tax=Bacillus massiliglaciei TaxID=1816693 RepID=UPI000DA625FB|nr:hypothetical protein [Bacillus massiliglaciei]